MSFDITSDINKEYAAEMRYPEVDRFIVNVHWWAFGVLLLLSYLNSFVQLAAIYPSPLSWRVISTQEAMWTVGIGFVAVLLPVLLRGRMSNHYLWRLLLCLTISIFSYLFVFISGGSIEMHFLFFVLIALMAIYSDWRLGWFMLVAVALHHGILNYLSPTWVYYYGRNDVAVIAHAVPVLVIVIFTTMLTRNSRNVIRDLVAVRTGLVGAVEQRERELKTVKATSAAKAATAKKKTTKK